MIYKIFGGLPGSQMRIGLTALIVVEYFWDVHESCVSLRALDVKQFICKLDIRTNNYPN